MAESFDWQLYPEAEQWILDLIESACRQNIEIATLRESLLNLTSTRLFDWLDHLTLPFSPSTALKLEQFGYSLQETEAEGAIYAHKGAQFPRIVLHPTTDQVALFCSVDQIADFLMAWGHSHSQIEGAPFGCYRRCLVSKKGWASLWVVERRGTQGLHPTEERGEELKLYLEVMEAWQKRARAFEDESLAIGAAIQLARWMVEQVGVDRAAWSVLEVERRYWQMRNRAGQIQKNRQDRLGMGWANHDHHTFRSSRKNFPKLVSLFECLGFTCRERFYAGEEAGWGAQVMENPACRLVLFLDVDLSPEEIRADFAHTPLEELDALGTIGLWCGLHGDSILQGGMHHLEAQFMFDELTQDLSTAGINMMGAFSNFSFLRQAFTEGERWAVLPERVEKLVRTGRISEAQAQKFLREGAIGSHLENLQRRSGYKGFNQHNVSSIIRRTDPRLI